VCARALGGAGVPWCVELSETFAGAVLAASVLAEASSFVLSSTKRTPLLHVTTHPHPPTPTPTRPPTHPHPHTRYISRRRTHTHTHTDEEWGKEASRRDLGKLRRPLGVTYRQAKEASTRDPAKAKPTAYVSIHSMRDRSRGEEHASQPLSLSASHYPVPLTWRLLGCKQL
jgi:hypothetical protein